MYKNGTFISLRTGKISKQNIYISCHYFLSGKCIPNIINWQIKKPVFCNIGLEIHTRYTVNFRLYKPWGYTTLLGLLGRVSKRREGVYPGELIGRIKNVFQNKLHSSDFNAPINVKPQGGGGGGRPPTEN